MLTIYDQAHQGRRNFLRVGLGGLAGTLATGTPNEVTSNALAATSVENAVATGKSVIFLFMHGGPSQIETFDPKMTAPREIRSATGEVATTLPGITFGGTFPRLAQLMDKMAIVRSFATGDGAHNIKPVVARETSGANIGSYLARVIGTNHPVSGMPTNVALFPRAVEPESQPAQKQFGNFTDAGKLGSAYAPFMPGGEGQFQDDLKLKIGMDRLDHRRELLAALDGMHRNLESEERASSLDRLRAQTYATLLGGVADAFDLSKEDAKTLARYDTAPLMQPDDIRRKWNNHKYYVDNVRTLGKLLLMARRLCERGCGFVTVTTNFVWDMHADANNAGMEEGMNYMGAPFDYAVSALIEDVFARGLENDILLVATGEMGRTPRINKRGGRDHWGRIAPLLLSGGGLNMGQVIGQSNRDASEPQSNKYDIKNLLATIYQTQYDVGELRLQPGLPADFLRAANSWEPIRELF